MSTPLSVRTRACSACARCSSWSRACSTGWSYLSAWLSLILAFIGVKLVLHWAYSLSDAIPEIQTSLSSVVILAVLIVTTVASLIKSRRDPEARAHAGSLRAARAATDGGR